MLYYYITKSKSEENYFSGMIVTAPDVVLTNCWFGPRVKFVAAHCVNCEQGVRLPGVAKPQDVPLQDGYVTIDKRTEEEKSAVPFDEQKAFVIKECLRQKAEKKAEAEQEEMNVEGTLSEYFATHTVVDSSNVFIDAPGTDVTVTEGQNVHIRVDRRYSPYRRSPSPSNSSPPSARSFIVRTERQGNHTHTSVCGGTGLSLWNVHNVNIDIRK